MIRNVFRLMRERHSSRVPFDLRHPVTEMELQQLLEAARWAPTAHNMQNFEMIVVDDRVLLDQIGRVRAETSKEFIRENYAQLSFSEQELCRKGTGLLATMFPSAWRSPDADPSQVVDLDHAFLGGAIHNAPLLLIVAYDSGKRAPASEGDCLGFMSLGCVMQNLWLMAEALDIAMQILSVFAAPHVEQELQRILGMPEHLKIAYACRLGHPASPPPRYLRVRRTIAEFVHRNRYGTPQSASESHEMLPP